MYLLAVKVIPVPHFCHVAINNFLLASFWKISIFDETISSRTSPVQIIGEYFSNLFFNMETVSLKVENITTFSPFSISCSAKSTALSTFADGMFSVVKNDGQAVACRSLLTIASILVVFSSTLSTWSFIPLLILS